jgi:hypothetical protein
MLHGVYVKYRLALILVPVLPLLASLGQEAKDPDVVLAQTRSRILADVARLPRYICEQTITRHYYLSPTRSPGSCKQIIAERDKRTHELTVSGWDRLRLEVAVAGSSEIYSWVGAGKLGQTSLEEIAGSGPLGSGDFGSFITSILNIATIRFEREQVVGNRHLLEYSYDVPQFLSGYRITTRLGSFITAYSGTFLIDTGDMDLVHLTVRSADLPAESGHCQVISEVEYGRVPVHGNPILIPHETQLRTIGRTGDEALATTSYANCHEFRSKSVLRFGPVDMVESTPTKSAPAQPQNSIPYGIQFDLRIITPIDSDTAAGGDPLEAVLRSPIRDKSGAVLVAVGTRLHGHLVKVEHQSSRRPYVQIAVEFDSIDLNGKSMPFGAMLATQGAIGLHIMGAPVDGHMVGGHGHFTYFGDRLKLDHLDAKGVTLSPDLNQ